MTVQHLAEEFEVEIITAVPGVQQSQNVCVVFDEFRILPLGIGRSSQSVTERPVSYGFQLHDQERSACRHGHPDVAPDGHDGRMIIEKVKCKFSPPALEWVRPLS